ncbi:MAG: transposase [Bacteroidota bacterium]
MGYRYNFHDNTSLYFVTLTLRGWVDLFSRKCYRDEFIKSLNYCCENKGLVVYAYVIMTNHVHLIISTEPSFLLRDTFRDLKKYTAKVFLELVQDPKESRRSWIMWLWKYFGCQKGRAHQIWKEGSHPIELYSQEVIKQKLDYIHNNPVKAGFVSESWMWVYSSSLDYKGEKGLLDIELLGGVF